MKHQFNHAVVLPLIAILFSAILTTPSLHAQFRFYGQNQFESNAGKGELAPAYRNLSQNVFALNELADEMLWRYQWEAQKMPNCQSAQSLYDQMKKHSVLTNNLIMAYRGDSNKQFEETAIQVRDSVNSLLVLRNQTETSETVNRLILQSQPMANFVYSNAMSFQPEPGGGNVPALSSSSIGKAFRSVLRP